MGKKIFISYKYGDRDVFPLVQHPPGSLSAMLYQPSVRDYVDEIQRQIPFGNHINKGEADGESLAHFKDTTIESRLRAKIYDSSITVVLISPNMIDPGIPESDQWIPWEIAYSLREKSKLGTTSAPNALLAVVLPDRYRSYTYFIEERNCTCGNGCVTLHTENLFQILRDNMYNRKISSYLPCAQGSEIYSIDSSYIYWVKWDDFIGNMNRCFDAAVFQQSRIEHFNIVKTIKQEILNGIY